VSQSQRGPLSLSCALSHIHTHMHCEQEHGDEDICEGLLQLAAASEKVHLAELQVRVDVTMCVVAVDCCCPDAECRCSGSVSCAFKIRLIPLRV